ncbi:FAM207/SLX9 family protein [Aspergillus saccharolyticus JOP 1030-1]|uniref:Ribosome biogenesis protein SLX9 n=1 Tax=Aspergillus saccharolyticus JOP 1030-1 TaxID=1450539 RepID=A0A319A098_9EURO|nr:hypothetical protein BP01DRAFT_9590 [Aspergillus saccharolyticus JOP 1030-1]PYH49930.1 hypothetical protein BP01DRAFT_9590 [Aspergillus saccharolyticus JOP 1030-1]
MAPIRPGRKQDVAKKPAGGSGTLPTNSSLFDEFRTTKKDKRLIKHASFVSKIEKSSKKTNKRRRASKKLVTNLDSLADALPEAEEELNDSSNQVNIIKQKTLKHKPGAMKRKEKLEKLERDRFSQNMAQLSSMEAAATSNVNAISDTNAGSNRWAALRSFISQTMEHQPAFKTNK